MSNGLQGRRVAVLAADGVEQVELVQPMQAVRDPGADVVLLSLEPGTVQAYDDDVEPAGTFAVDEVMGRADPGDYDALILPGGTTNPDHLRVSPEALSFVQGVFAAGKPVGVICHGPWTLVSADLVRGRTLTSWPSLRVDLQNAGATWVDEEVVTDHGLVSSRNPGDLPAFCAAIVAEFAGGAHRVTPAGATA